MSDQALSGQLISSRPALTFRDGGNYWLGSSACRLSLTIHHDHDSWFIVIGFHRRPAGLGKTKRQAIHRNQSNRCVQALLEALNRPSSRFRLPLMIVLCGLAGAHRSRCQNGQTMAAIPNRSLKRQIRRVNCLSSDISPSMPERTTGPDLQYYLLWRIFSCHWSTWRQLGSRLFLCSVAADSVVFIDKISPPHQ